jgi:hypothetical protein
LMVWLTSIVQVPLPLMTMASPGRSVVGGTPLASQLPDEDQLPEPV